MNIEVLLATYRGENFIEDQLWSILNSNLGDNINLSIVVSDDGSDDNTATLVKKICSVDSRVKLLSAERKGGVKCNFRYLIENASNDCELYFFSDQDDFWLPNKIREFVNEYVRLKALHDRMPILIHSDLCVVDQDLFPIERSMFKGQALNPKPTLIETVVQNSVTGCAMAINTELFRLVRHASFDDAIMHDWYIAIVAEVFGITWFIDKPTVLYRQHGGNQVGAKIMRFADFLSLLMLLKENIRISSTSVLSTKRQAEAVIRDFGDLMDCNKRKLIQDYIDGFNSNVVKRLKLAIFGGARKYGYIRRLAFFIIFVFHLY